MLALSVREKVSFISRNRIRDQNKQKRRSSRRHIYAQKKRRLTMFVNRLLRYDWPFGYDLFNLCALEGVDLAVLLDEEHAVTENLGALYLVGLYILYGSRFGFFDGKYNL